MNHQLCHMIYCYFIHFCLGSIKFNEQKQLIKTDIVIEFSEKNILLLFTWSVTTSIVDFNSLVKKGVWL